MRALRRTIGAIIAASLLALPLAAPKAMAQDGPRRGDAAASDSARGAPAILVADHLSVVGRTRLVAEGHVEAVQGDTRLRATRIVYDRSSETLQIDGPIVLTEGGTTRILAESAELSRDLERGLLRSARMVLDNRVQMAANQIDRVGGRYTQLYKVAATSCRICERDQPPLWQIRARRVVHDEEAGQLYFDQAQLRVLDVPVLWLPRLRLPDPTQTRATGFLIPSLHQSTQLGFGVRVPYFIRMGDHRDLTLTPYIATETTTLEWRYRQAFRRGRIAFSGSISDDTLPISGLRGHVFGEGRFELGNDFRLDFGIEAVSDRPYLLEYDYSDEDRLRSGVELSRVRRDEFIRAELVHFNSLRPGENNATLPTIIAGARYERRLFPRALGGELRLSAETSAHRRTSNSIADADGDLVGDGLDVARAGVTADWRRTWTLAGGLRAGLVTGVALDAFDIAQDPASAGTHTQATPHAALTLRWPLAKTTAAGVTHVIEPVAMLGWTGGSRLGVPNDESTRVEFDQGNLLSLSHFPAPDRRERGGAAAVGVNWSRMGPTGWRSDLTLGQVFFDTPDPAFTQSSGLAGRASDMLVAGRIDAPGGLELGARGLLDPDALSLSKGEARAQWQTATLSLGSSVVWLRRDAAENRPADQSEWAFDGAYRLSRHWTGRADWRYDLANDQAARAGVALEYRNECVEIGVSVSRRFTSSALVAPSTNFGFTVGLSGFSASAKGDSYARTCRK
jgi:LPS-assembly protein